MLEIWKLIYIDDGETVHLAKALATTNDFMLQTFCNRDRDVFLASNVYNDKKNICIDCQAGLLSVLAIHDPLVLHRLQQFAASKN